MAEAAAATKAHVEIPRSFLEYTLLFEMPILKAWERRSAIASDFLEATKQWGFNLEGFEIKSNTDKVSEHALIFRRTQPPSPPVSIALFLNKIFIAAENLDWTDAENFIAASTTAVDVIRRASSCTFKSQHIGLGMHIQLKNKTLHEVTGPLLSPAGALLSDEAISFSGVIINREKSSISVDLSLAYANALWVRMFREHPPTASLQDIAASLRSDEEQLFTVLGLEGVL